MITERVENGMPRVTHLFFRALRVFPSLLFLGTARCVTCRFVAMAGACRRWLPRENASAKVITKNGNVFRVHTYTMYTTQARLAVVPFSNGFSGMFD